MKLWFILFLLLVATNALTQNCPQGNIILSSQSQVDSFPVLYPGCNAIDVDLSVSGPDIHDLSPLQQIDTIRGRLEILENPLLASLQGLNHVRFIHYLYIVNTGLTDLNPLHALRKTYSLTLAGNQHLTSIDSLHQLTSIDGIIIQGNPRLKSLHGLHHIHDNMGFLWIEYNDSLVNFQGLNALQFQWSMVLISGNARLESFEGLEQLIFIGSDLAIGSNPQLQSFHGLENLRETGGFFLTANPRLKDMQGLNQLEVLGRVVYINYNDSLTTLNGLESVEETYTMSMHIHDNPQLTSLWGARNMELNRFDIFKLDVYDNASLFDCDIPGVCNRLAEDFTAPFTFVNNAQGCSSIDEVRNDCITASHDVSIPLVEILTNPVSELLHLKSDMAFESYTICSISGQQIIATGSLSGQEIDVSDLRAGMYVIRLKHRGQFAIVRFVKV